MNCGTNNGDLLCVICVTLGSVDDSVNLKWKSMRNCYSLWIIYGMDRNMTSKRYVSERVRKIRGFCQWKDLEDFFLSIKQELSIVTLNHIESILQIEIPRWQKCIDPIHLHGDRQQYAQQNYV